MKKFDKPIYTSVPSLSSLDEFTTILSSAWKKRILTHNGPLVQLLEARINDYLNSTNTISVTNGTIALQLAIKALGLKGEIITTPFTWIATASAIKWEGCTPVFADIDRNTLNIDPNNIESLITEETKAIMPVHVFSNPANIDSICEIASKYGLKVIYDAAHAFGVNYKGSSVMDFGDISCTSFHATKIFNTGEGGACFTKDDYLYEKIKSLRFFGHDDEKNIVLDGINGKMTEIHAAIGLANLPNQDLVVEKRRNIFSIYYNKLHPLKKVTFQKFDPNEYNYSYMPIILPTETICIKILKTLNQYNIFPRRYFFPSLNTINAVRKSKPMPISDDISKRILCLPSNNDMSFEEVDQIAKIVFNTLS